VAAGRTVGGGVASQEGAVGETEQRQRAAAVAGRQQQRGGLRGGGEGCAGEFCVAAQAQLPRDRHEQQQAVRLAQQRAA